MHPSIVRLNENNTQLLDDFLEHAGRSLRSFRYYDKRPRSITEQHACTLLLTDEGKAVAYGHLDPEGGKTWLGIAVTETATGKGYGRMMMQALIGEARAQQIPALFLSVDNDNLAAIRLYEKNGFVLQEEKGAIRFYHLDLS